MSIAASPAPSVGQSTPSPSVGFTPLTETRALLAKIPVSRLRELIPTRHKHHRSEEGIVVILSSEQPMNAFRRLIDNGIQSAPVIDEKSGKITGLLDLRDLVSLVVLMVDEHKQQRAAAASGEAAPVFGSPRPGTPPKQPAAGSHHISKHKPGDGLSSSSSSSAADAAEAAPATARSRSKSPARGGAAGAAAGGVPAGLGASSQYLGLLLNNLSSFSPNTKAVDHKPEDFSVKYLAARNR